MHALLQISLHYTKILKFTKTSSKSSCMFFRCFEKDKSLVGTTIEAKKNIQTFARDAKSEDITRPENVTCKEMKV